MRILDLVKDKKPLSVASNQTVLEAARLMVEHNIGAVPVLAGGELVGMFSERDVMNRVVAEARNPATTKISDVMTAHPTTVSPDEDIHHCMVLMKQHGFRHLPVCSGKDLVALVSLRDLLLHDLNEKDGEVRLMRAYIGSGVSE